MVCFFYNPENVWSSCSERAPVSRRYQLDDFRCCFRFHFCSNFTFSLGITGVKMPNVPLLSALIPFSFSLCATSQASSIRVIKTKCNKAHIRINNKNNIIKSQQHSADSISLCYCTHWLSHYGLNMQLFPGWTEYFYYYQETRWKDGNQITWFCWPALSVSAKPNKRRHI